MLYVFGEYELDTQRYELRLGGTPLRVEPKVFDLLAYLVQQQGQCVLKEHLHEHLWPNQFVSESALTYCVTAARKAVGDDGREQRLIKTVYGRRYRFIASVQERWRGAADEAVPPCSCPAYGGASPSPWRHGTARGRCPVRAGTGPILRGGPGGPAVCPWTEIPRG